MQVKQSNTHCNCNSRWCGVAHRQKSCSDGNVACLVPQLNHLVTEQLVKCGVPTVGISPFGVWRTAGKKVSQAGISAIRDALDAGYIPVMHGDCALDSEQHCCILSGDAIIEVLSREFSPQRVVFLTDVSGIYDRPPDTPDMV
ncbi:uncharacterized protein LOC135983254 [Chrysemys picta bellii]|uniref:uncharacterized protein LOC135983254 n=1 Tax=Chrysemys picta bellii TaxID=8478 RepID=UPI0032B1B50A